MGSWVKIEQALFSRYLGKPKFFNGEFSLKMEKSTGMGGKVYTFWNNSLNAAPAFKWALAIVPFYGMVTGKPKVEDIDLNQTLALTGTGLVWSYYGTIVTPRADLLVAVNLALLIVNGYNLFRKTKYEMGKKESNDS